MPTRTTSSRALGFAYKLNDKTVVRGGWGIYTSPFVFSNGINQMGYLAVDAVHRRPRTTA